MAVHSRGGLRSAPVGSVVEQKRGGSDVLVFQESADRSTVIETIDDVVAVAERLVGGIKRDLDELNEKLEVSNAKLGLAMSATRRQIDANQQLLDRLLVEAG